MPFCPHTPRCHRATPLRRERRCASVAAFFLLDALLAADAAVKRHVAIQAAARRHGAGDAAQLRLLLRR